MAPKCEIPQCWRNKCWLPSKLKGPTGKGERDEIVSAEVSLAPWGLSMQLDGWVIPDEPADNSKDYWKPYGLVFWLPILIQFSLHCTVNTQLADGRKAESTHQDEMIILAWMCPCMCWCGSGLYCQPLVRAVLGDCSAMPCGACSVFLLCPFLGGGGQLLPTCPFHVMPSWLPRWGGRGYQMLFESLKNTSFFSGGKLQPLPGLVRSTAAKPLFLGSYLLEYLCPFNIAFPLSCYWRKVSSQHMSDCVEFCTQAFDVISCCSWYPSFKRSHGELLITSLYCLFSLMRQRLNSFSDHLKPC